MTWKSSGVHDPNPKSTTSAQAFLLIITKFLKKWWRSPEPGYAETESQTPQSTREVAPGGIEGERSDFESGQVPHEPMSLVEEDNTWQGCLHRGGMIPGGESLSVKRRGLKKVLYCLLQPNHRTVFFFCPRIISTPIITITHLYFHRNKVINCISYRKGCCSVLRQTKLVVFIDLDR